VLVGDKSPPHSLTRGSAVPNECKGLVAPTIPTDARPAWDTSRVLKLVHEGKIVWRYVSLIALLAHPAFCRIAIPEHPSVDMLVA